MATITSNTFLDGGTARTAGEAWTINGGVLTIRTDTRWHANAPASMTGSIGNVTISATLGGGVLLDGTNVREVQFDTGSGNVPAIGTSITQGGVTGYLLGVWANLASAPTAVGAAMPTTGFIKFREVTGGNFAAGALAGIGANATGADTTSWIEVVYDQATANIVPRLGFYRTRGTWYTLPQTTSGSAHQSIQIPTNGGGTGTRVPCVWIETGVGTNVYENYPAVLITWFNTTNLGTDERSKFVLMDTNGTIRIGGDGTNVCGFIPPAGCRIRIPNILGRQTSSANRALNLVPNATLATRPDFTTTSAGDIDFEYMMDDWYHLFTAPYRVRMINCATMDVHTTSNEASPTELDNYVTGHYQAGIISLTALNNPLGGTITDCSFYRPDAASNGHSMSMTGCSNYTFNGLNETGIIQYARSTGLVSFSQCRNFDINGVFYLVQVTATPSTSFNFDFELIRYIDRLVGTTNATTGKYVATCLVSSDNIVVNNVDFGGYANLHPYLGVFNASNSSNLKLRCGNTFATPIGGATNAPGSIFVDSGNNDTVKIQNCYLTATRTSLYTSVNTSKNITIERLTGTVGSTQTLSVNALSKGLRSASNSVAGGASVYGTHFFDMFESDTAGRVWLAMNEPTAFSSSLVSLTLAGSSGGFTSGGQVAMPTVGDVLIAEMPYYAVGHTAFANSAATLTGTNTGNFSYEYALDPGTGVFSSYQTLNGANLSAETISPTTGFKLRLRITCTTGASNNALTYVRISTVSTLVAQEAASYPEDTVDTSYSFTGLDVGTEVVLFSSSNVELDRKVISGTTYTYNYTWISDIGDVTGVYALIWKDDRTPLKLTGITLGNSAQSVPITQTDDLVYATGYTPKTTFNTSLFLQIMDTGVSSISISQMYSEWKDWLRLSSNAQYTFMYVALGGNVISGATSVPFYIFLNNSWRVRPDEANHTLNIIEGVIVATGDPFVDTVGTYTVRINYQQPVQAITVSTGGGGGATPADIWGYSTRTLSTGGVSAIQSGLATSAEITALNDISASDVLTQATSALTTYDPPTKAELDTAESNIIASAGGATPTQIWEHTINGKQAQARLQGAEDSAELASIK